jgi:glucose/arabinose dehydrogenase
MPNHGALRLLVPIAVIAIQAGSAGTAGAVEKSDLSHLKLPSGFSASVYAEVPGARSMALAPSLGVIFVGTRDDTLYAVTIGDGRAGAVRKLSTDLKVPNGVAFHDGWLYIAEQSRIVRYRPTRDHLAPHDLKVVRGGLPDRAAHGWRYAAFGPDGKLYVTVGLPCNICKIEGLEGTIVRMNPDGSSFEVFARGIRNSVGIDFQPKTGIAFFTDNGGDGLGDDVPPDELNRAPKAGLDFGFPHYAGGDTVSPRFRDQKPSTQPTFPVLKFRAHVAALGLQFYRGAMFPEDYRNDAFVAQHGSWNRSVPDGYRVMRVHFDDSGKAVRAEPFAQGFLQSDGNVWGRPVDVKTLPDGSLLVSDDHGGAIYRITYGAR